MVIAGSLLELVLGALHAASLYNDGLLLTAAMAEDAVSGELHQGDWRDIGTPLAAIANHFGAEMLTEQGLLDRRALRERIFSDPAAKSWLNALLHPIIRSEMLRQCASGRAPLRRSPIRPSEST